jgi:hypothetical protein
MTNDRSLETATAGREKWQYTTTTDAGKALFGTINQE